MKITEENIFNYIFYPAVLSPDLKEEIESDGTLTGAIQFYKQLKSNIEENELSREVKEILAKKIPVYTKSNIILLTEMNSIHKQRSENNHLAAGTETSYLEPRVGSKTFTDNKNEFIVRVVTDKSTTKIFIFSTRSEVIENFDLVIEPQGTKFHLPDNKNPLLLNEVIDISNIKIKFN